MYISAKLSHRNIKLLLISKYFYAISAIGFANVGFVKPVATEDAVLFADFDGKNERILTMLIDILNHVETELENGDDYEQTLLEVLPIDELVQEPMYSKIVGHNICGIKEKSIALLNRYDNLQSIGVSGLLDM